VAFGGLLQSQTNHCDAVNYYNEFDPGAAQWLRNLIDAKLLPAGMVDERDIRLVQPSDLKEFTQCHFFAGIGGWSLALALAGWPEDRKVWTGSCPYQPFSMCGKKRKEKDDRHLWPEFKRLISEFSPPVVFGEQVDSKDGVEWLSGVRADLEACGYEVGCAGLPAACVKAPHLRQRLWFVADRHCKRLEERTEQDSQAPQPGLEASRWTDVSGRGLAGDLAYAKDANGRGGIGRQEAGAWKEEFRGRGPSGSGSDGRLEHSAGEQVGLPGRARKQGISRGYWDAFDIVQCTDGKARRIEPGTFPLAHGVPNRVVKLRAYGNAIVPQVAAEFVRAYMEVRGIV